MQGNDNKACAKLMHYSENGAIEAPAEPHWVDLLSDLLLWLSEPVVLGCPWFMLTIKPWADLQITSSTTTNERGHIDVLCLGYWEHLIKKQESWIPVQFWRREEEKSDELVDHTKSWTWEALQCSGRRNLLSLSSKFSQYKQEEESWGKEYEGLLVPVLFVWLVLYYYIIFIFPLVKPQKCQGRQEPFFSVSWFAKVWNHASADISSLILYFSASLSVEWCSCNKEQ